MLGFNVHHKLLSSKSPDDIEDFEALLPSDDASMHQECRKISEPPFGTCHGLNTDMLAMV